MHSLRSTAIAVPAVGLLHMLRYSLLLLLICCCCPGCLCCYAAAVWELLTGDRPFRGLLEGDLLLGVCEQGMRPSFPPGAPADYVALAKQCWADSPAERPTAPQARCAVWIRKRQRQHVLRCMLCSPVPASCVLLTCISHLLSCLLLRAAGEAAQSDAL